MFYSLTKLTARTL